MQFQAGDTRNINGVTYQRQADGRWTPQGGQGGGGRLVPLAPPPPPAPPSGYQPAPGGLAPIPGGPADPSTKPPPAPNLPTGYQMGPNGQAQRIPGLPEPETSDPKLKEAERTAAFLTSRLAQSFQEIESVTRRAPAAAKPVLGVEAVRGIFGDTAANYLNDEDRQIVEGAQLNILDSALTLGTGAAYTREQLEGYRKSYFPQLGDGPDTIKAKQERLRTVLEAAKLKAGAAAPQIDQLLASLGGAPAQLTDDQARDELDQRISRGDSPAATIKWLIDVGRPPSEEQIAAIVANYGNKNPDVRSPGSQLGRRFAVGAGDVVEGIGDIAGLVGNPLNAGINAVTGSNLSTDLGQTFRDASGLPSPESEAERFSSAINQGGMMGLGLAGAARGLAAQATPVLGNALARFGAAPLTDAAAGASGGGSAEVARQQGAGPAGQIAAGLVGGGAAIPIAGRLNSMMNPRAPVQNALTRAGEAEGVTVNRAMADSSVQNRVTGAEATMTGGPMIRRGMGAVGSQIEGRVRNLGRGGEALEENVAGQTLQRASERFIKTTGAKAREQYNSAEKAAGGIKVAPARSLQVVDDVLAKLKETPETNSAEIAFLEKLRTDFQADLSVGALRRVRTSLRKRISKGELTFGEDEATVLSVMEAAAEDISQGLVQAGKAKAARLFRQADLDYRQRMDFIQNTIQKVVGKRGANLPAERVFANLKAMASPKGDEAGLARMMRTLDPDERTDIAATFAEALGNNGKGDFSTAHFLRQAEKLPKAARLNVFGEEGARSIENLLLLAREHSRVMGGLNNSRTGVANDYRSWLSNALFGGGTGTMAGLLTQSGTTGMITAVGTAAAAGLAKGTRDVLTARMLMSPNIAKWLSSAPRGNSAKAINSHFDRLKAIAAREPAIASEIEQLQQAIIRVANDNARSVAAETGREQENNR